MASKLNRILVSWQRSGVMPLWNIRGHLTYGDFSAISKDMDRPYASSSILKYLSFRIYLTLYHQCKFVLPHLAYRIP